MRVDVWVLAVELLNRLSEIGDEHLLVPIVEECAGEGCEGGFRDWGTGVASGVEFQLRDAVEENSG